jgi:hypothetical protein
MLYTPAINDEKNHIRFYMFSTLDLDYKKIVTKKHLLEPNNPFM